MNRVIKSNQIVKKQDTNELLNDKLKSITENMQNTELLETKNYNNKSFYCLRCKKQLGRTTYFKKHCLGDAPTKRCKNVGVDIDWLVVKHDAEKQLNYYKKHKKYLYNEKPTDEQKKDAIINSNDFINQVFRYDLELTEEALQIWETKQKKLGYEILRVKADLHSLPYPKKITYLIKDKIIYTPYRNNKRYLIKVGYVDDIYYEPSCFNLKEKSEEYKERYNLNDTTNKDTRDNAFIDNVCKINPQLQRGFDKDEDGWIIDVYTQPELQFKRYVIKEDRTVLNPNRCLKAQSKPYGYNLTYYTDTFYETIRTFKINEYPINHKIKKHTFTAKDTMTLLYFNHYDKTKK